MTGSARIAATLLIALTAWGVGRATAPVQDSIAAEIPTRAAPAPTRPAWRDALEAARATAGGDVLRARSHDVLNTAETAVALSDAIELLGWTGTEGDTEWLESIALSRDPELEYPAIEALGRLGTDAAVDALIRLEGEDRTSGPALAALGATGDLRAYGLLVQRLSHPDQGVNAATALARFGTPAAAHEVADALQRARPNQIGGMAQALARFPGEEPRQILHDELNAGSQYRRDAALSALAQVRDPMVYDLLVADLTGGSARRKSQAAWLLGSLQDPRAVHPLHNAALSGSRELQSAAVQGLAQIDTRQSRQVLIELVDVGPEQVAYQAAWAIPNPERQDAVEALCGAWSRRSWNVRSAITNRLFNAAWGVSAVPEAVLELARAELSDLPPGSNTQAPAFLLEHGTADDIAAVETLLTDGPTQARMRVVQALTDWPGTSAERLLFRSMDDSDASVRDSAVRALLQRGINPERLEEPLLAQLQSGTGMHGRVEQLLVELGTPRAIAAVQQRLESGTLREQNAAIQALAWSGEVQAVEALRTAAEGEPNVDQRRQIYQALMWSPSGANDDLAQTLMDDEDASIRSMGVQMLSQAGPAARDQLLVLSDESDPQIRLQALSALGQVGGPEAEARLIEALDDPELGGTAISSLAQMGTRRSREVLHEAAAGHADPMVRTSALQQLAWQGGAGAQEVLTQALGEDDSSIRQAALSALEGIGNSQAAEALASALDDEDETVAQTAATALQRLGGPVAGDHAAAIEDIVGPQEDIDLSAGGGFYFDEKW